MIRALIFDMDNTLVDSEALHYEAWRQVLARHGVDSFPFEAFVDYVGTSNETVAEDYISSMGWRHMSVAALVREKQLVYLEMIPGIRLLPGVAQAISRFHSAFRLAVASSSHRLELTRILATLGLTEQFEVVVGGDMVSRKKPDPEIYLTASSLLELEPCQCVAFEDSEAGLAAAKAAGLWGIAIPSGLSRRHDFSRADLVVERMDQLDAGRLRSLVQIT